MTICSRKTIKWRFRQLPWGMHVHTCPTHATPRAMCLVPGASVGRDAATQRQGVCGGACLRHTKHIIHSIIKILAYLLFDL